MEQAQRWTHLEGLVKNPAGAPDRTTHGGLRGHPPGGRETSEENQRVAQEALARAASFIEELMPDMPKPVDVPPQVIMIPHQDIGKERALIWSLGMDWQAAEEPQASILIGRGRRLGLALKGDAITSVQLQEMLAVAGQGLHEVRFGSPLDAGPTHAYGLGSGASAGFLSMAGI